MYLFEIKNGKVNELSCGQPTIFVTEEQVSLLLKDNRLLLAVEKQIPVNSILCALGDEISNNVYNLENTATLNLDDLIKTQGEYGFYEHISEK